MQNTKQKRKSPSWSFTGAMWEGMKLFVRGLAVLSLPSLARGMTITDTMSNRTIYGHTVVDDPSTAAMTAFTVDPPVTAPVTVECDIYADPQYFPKDCEDQMNVGVSITYWGGCPPSVNDCCRTILPISAKPTKKRFQIYDTTSTNTCNVKSATSKSLCLSPSSKPCSRPDNAAYNPIVKIGNCKIVDGNDNNENNTVCYKP